MRNAEKYTRQFFPAPAPKTDWMQKTYIDRAPQWCSVDLRDGNVTTDDTELILKKIAKKI